jgi:hypothetical protein
MARQSPLRVTTDEETDGRAVVTAFTCCCGTNLVAPNGDDRVVTAGIDELDCPDCPRTWTGGWRGMEFCTGAEKQRR